MARIRSIKPEFCRSESIVALPVPVRLHFAMLWTYADDYGRGVDNPRLIKGDLWPLDDDVTPAVIESYQASLAAAGRIVRYEVDGKAYFEVVNWAEHQHPQKRKDSTIPEPSGTSTRQVPDEDDTEPVAVPPVVVVGEVEVVVAGEVAVTPPSAAESLSYHPAFAEWWDRYPRKVGKQAAHKAWLKAKRSRGHVALLAAITAHAAVWDLDGTDPQFIPHPATWLNEGRYDDPPPQATKARTKVDRTRIALVQGATQLDQGGPTFAERFAAAGGQPSIEAGLA